MIDLVLQGTLANLRTLLVGRGLLVQGTDDQGATTYTPAPGFDYCLWAGSGKFMTAKGTYDAQGVELTPPTYLAGFVVLARITTADDAIVEGAEQWQRSQIAKWIKTNGTLGTFGGMPCYTVSSVRMMRAADVFAWCAANNMPAHEWAGGNSI